eukprot:COSAG01_NODE_3761_length_5722_cov_2.962298_8_plen_73_part_00
MLRHDVSINRPPEPSSCHARYVRPHVFWRLLGAPLSSPAAATAAAAGVGVPSSLASRYLLGAVIKHASSQNT